MNMYALVESAPRDFQQAIYKATVDDDPSGEKTAGTIQTHPKNSHIGIEWQSLVNDLDVAWRYAGEDEYSVTTWESVVQEAIRDARRWLALERGGWLA